MTRKGLIESLDFHNYSDFQKYVPIAGTVVPALARGNFFIGALSFENYLL
jgi:hypothetical protein